MDDTIGKVPIHLKMTLTTIEAAEYSNIGIIQMEHLWRKIISVNFIMLVQSLKSCSCG